MTERISDHSFLEPISSAPSLAENGHASDVFAAIKKRNPKFEDPDSYPGDHPKSTVLLLVANGHLDKAWYWPTSRGNSRANHTFLSALNLMDQFDDFTFNASSADHYYQVQKHDPGMFQEIQGRVAEGRWGVFGGGWVEPDMNKPSSESIVNSFRISQQFFTEELGITPTVALEADAFGHPDSIISLLNDAGFTFYMHMRPQASEKSLPLSPYRWQMDGYPMSIDAQRIFEEYASGPNTTEFHVRRAAQAIQGRLRYLPVFFGTGNHGGGPTVPVLKRISELQDEETLPQLAYVTSEEVNTITKIVFKDLPVVSGPLQWHAPGCYSLNQENERLSQEAEAVRDTSRAINGVIHWINKTPYPHKEFRTADQKQAELDFHDIRAGSSIETVYKDTAHGLGGVIDTGKTAISDALQNLGRELDLPEAIDSHYYLVYNHHPREVTSFVAFEENDFRGHVRIIDADETTVLPHQKVQPDATSVVGVDQRTKYGTLVKLPPGGYKVLEVKNNQAPVTFESLEASENHLENEHIRVTFDQETGAILHFIDKNTGYDLAYHDNEGLHHPFGMPVICDETINGRPVDTWGHKKTKWSPNVIEKAQYDPETGGYTLPVFEGFKFQSMQVKDAGPILARVQGIWRYKSKERAENPKDLFGDSVLIQNFMLYRDRPILEVNGLLYYYDSHKMLKLRYPVNLEMRRTSAQTAGGSASYGENGDEHLAQRWINVTGRRRDRHLTQGVAFFLDGLSGYSMDDRNLDLTIVTSRDFAQHEPALNDPASDHGHTDIGEHRFRYGIMPHQLDMEDVPLNDLAREFTQPPSVILETMRKNGFRPRSESFMAKTQRNVDVSGLRVADHAEGLVFSCTETAGKQTIENIHLTGCETPITVPLKPKERKTVRVLRDGTYEVIDSTELQVKSVFPAPSPNGATQKEDIFTSNGKDSSGHDQLSAPNGHLTDSHYMI